MPIAGAGITTTPATDATVTGPDGRFTVPDALVGSYTISANRNGYAPNTASVSVREARTAQATIFLKPSATPTRAERPRLRSRPRSPTSSTAPSRRHVATRPIVVIDYRVRNTGRAVVSGYQVVFRIVTPAGDFFQDVTRTTLAVGQSAVGRVEKDTGGSRATDVRIDEFFIDGQARPVNRTGRSQRTR